MQTKAIISLIAAFAGLTSAAPSGSPPPSSGGGGGDSGDTPSYSGGGTYNGPLNEKHFQAILDEHNSYRGGCGLPKVRWNSQIAAVAQNYANSNPGGCSAMNHNNNRGDLGENIACTTATSADPMDEAVAMVARWGDEVESCGNNGKNCAFVGGSSKEGATGHFTQIVDSTCTEIGCGWNDGFFVCNYNPPGNASPSNACPNGFQGKVDGSGGLIDSNPTTPVTPTVPTVPTVPDYTSGSDNSGGSGSNYGPVIDNSPVVEIIDSESAYEDFNKKYGGNLIPVYDNSQDDDSGNNFPDHSYSGNNDSGNNSPPPSSYGNTNNNSDSGSSKPKKDCDQKKIKKARKFKKF